MPTAGQVNGVVVGYVVTKQLAGASSREHGFFVVDVPLWLECVVSEWKAEQFASKASSWKDPTEPGNLTG